MIHQHLKDLIHALNLKIEYLPEGNHSALGYYDAQSLTIWVNPKLTQRETTAVLAHELVHHLRGHHGPQSENVEKSVDEEAARIIISKKAYAEAENTYGPNPYMLAEALDTTVWIVEAYQRWLCKLLY